MKRLAFLSFTIATLIAPIQVQAQTGCANGVHQVPAASQPGSGIAVFAGSSGCPCLSVKS